MTDADNDQLYAIIEAIVEEKLARTSVSGPARVLSYDEEKGTVSVQPCLGEVSQDEDGNYVSRKLPQIDEVKVAFPRGGAWAITFPINVGDYVMLVHTDRALDLWQTNGGVLPTKQCRNHHLTDAWAIPGIYPDVAPLTESGIDTDLVAGKQGGGLLRIKADGTIELGTSASTKQFVALADDVKAELDEIKTMLDDVKTVFNAHVHVVTGTLPTGAGPAAAAAPAAPITASYTATEVASSKVKAQV